MHKKGGRAIERPRPKQLTLSLASDPVVLAIVLVRLRSGLRWHLSLHRSISAYDRFLLSTFVCNVAFDQKSTYCGSNKHLSLYVSRLPSLDTKFNPNSLTTRH